MGLIEAEMSIKAMMFVSGFGLCYEELSFLGMLLSLLNLVKPETLERDMQQEGDAIRYLR
jgi:hypothetical protein